MITILLRTKDGWEKRVPVHDQYIHTHSRYRVKQRVGPQAAWASIDLVVRDPAIWDREFRQTFADLTVYEEI